MMFCPGHENKEKLVSKSIGHCGGCINDDSSLMDYALTTHQNIRIKEGLVPQVPTDGSIVCPDCGNHCRLDEGEIGFCHLRIALDGQIIKRYSEKAMVSWYFDPLPTNCVADWVCPVTKSLELGSGKQRLNNLAVFYGSCNSDCLFCQNASFREMMATGRPLKSPREVADAANERTACVCYFGGDPACNPEHSLKVSHLLVEERGIRVCYETNGNISAKWLDKISEVVRKSEGTIKFDLKAVTPSIYTTLTGIANSVVLRNFRTLAAQGMNREGEFLVASILLVPGYIGINEVRKICEFIAECDPSIPTALLGFYPHHAMTDLPRTSRDHAMAAQDAAKDAGLTNVRVGNQALLSTKKYPFE
ncbi:MAG: radical SAM protein [Candidatus Thorarchaeota archaeon]